MKPAEILGMIEEAAGTRMYETKRVAAIKTIDKKQMKVDEINSVLVEEITPTLERLRGEKQNYLSWSKNNADIERIERLVVAYEFWNAQRALTNNTEGSAEMENQVSELNDKAAECRALVEEKEQEIRDGTSKLRGELGSEITELRGKEETFSKELVKQTSAWENSKNVVASAEKDLHAAQGLLTDTQKSLSDKENDITNDADRISSRKREAEEADRRHEQLKADYQNMSAGLSSSQGEGRTLPEQISDAHSDSKTAEAKAKQAEMKIAHLSASLEVSIPILFDCVFGPVTDLSAKDREERHGQGGEIRGETRSKEIRLPVESRQTAGFNRRTRFLPFSVWVS